MSLSQHTLTDVGRGYLAQAQLGELLTITRMVVGSGVAAVIPDDLYPLTALINYVMDVSITSQEYVTPDMIRVIGTLSSLDVPIGGSFELNEIGLMATVGVQPEVLYSVANTGGMGDTIPDMGSPAPVFQTIEIFIKIDNVANIVINVDPTGPYDCQNIGTPDIGAGPYSFKLGNLFNFKRLVMGTNIEIVEDQDTITIGEKILKVNLDVYVPETHPGGIPGANNPPTPETIFPDIQSAHDYLLEYTIPPNIFATIHVDGVTLSIIQEIKIKHPQASQIKLVGKSSPEVTFTGSAVTGGSAGNWSLRLSGISDFTNITLNSWALITFFTTFTDPNTNIYGFYRVTAVDAAGGTITVRHTALDATAPVISTGGSFYPINSIIEVPINMHGISMANLDSIQDIGLVQLGISNTACYGIACSGVLNINRVGVTGWKGPNCANINGSGNSASLYIALCAGVAGETGLMLGNGAFVRILSFYGNNNIYAGIQLSNGYLVLNGSCQIVGNSTGLSVSSQSKYLINGGNLLVMFAGWAIYCNVQAGFEIGGGASSALVRSNVTGDVYLNGNSYATGIAKLTGSRRFNGPFAGYVSGGRFDATAATMGSWMAD